MDYHQCFYLIHSNDNINLYKYLWIIINIFKSIFKKAKEVSGEHQYCGHALLCVCDYISKTVLRLLEVLNQILK